MRALGCEPPALSAAGMHAMAPPRARNLPTVPLPTHPPTTKPQFLLNIAQAARLLPNGAWQALYETVARRLHACGLAARPSSVSAAELSSSKSSAASLKLGDSGSADGSGAEEEPDRLDEGVRPAAPPPRLAALSRALSMGARIPAALAAVLPKHVTAAHAAATKGAAAAGAAAGHVALSFEQRVERRIGMRVMASAALLLWVPAQVCIIYILVKTITGNCECGVSVAALYGGAGRDEAGQASLLASCCGAARAVPNPTHIPCACLALVQPRRRGTGGHATAATATRARARCPPCRAPSGPGIAIQRTRC